MIKKIAKRYKSNLFNYLCAVETRCESPAWGANRPSDTTVVNRFQW